MRTCRATEDAIMTRYKSAPAEVALFPGTNIKADKEAIGLLRMLWTICRSEELVREWRLEAENAAELAALSPDEWNTREWELIELTLPPTSPRS